jgi:hypothetical protein
MALDDGQKIADIFDKCYDGRKFHWSKLKLSEFESVVNARANQDGLNFRQAGCTAEYQAGNQEIDAWELAIMMAEYTAHLLAKKAENGHGDKKKPSPMHVKMLSEFRASLENLVDQIKAREVSLK